MAQYDINLREYWRIVKKRKAIIIITAFILGFFSTTFAYFRAPTPIYTASCSIQFEKETTVEGLYAKTISWAGGDDIETQISIIKSFPIFEKVAEMLKLMPSERSKEKRGQYIGIIEGLQAKVTVTRENFTNILNIKAQDMSKEFAQKLANTVALTYKKLHSDQQTKRTDEAIKYINDQLKSVGQRLIESEDEFNRFTQDNQLISVDLQSENLLSRTMSIQGEVRKLRESRSELKGLLERLEGYIKKPTGSGNNFYSSAANPQYKASNDTLVELLLKKDTLLEDYTIRHPEIITVERKIAETVRKMEILLKLQIRDLDNKEKNLSEELLKVEQKTSSLMEKKLEFDRLKRKVALYTEMASLLEKKHQEAMIRKAEKPEEITIMKPARLPSYPINPPKTTTTGAMGVLIGLVLGLVTAFIVETFDTSLGAIEDVEETLGVQVLGVVPYADVKEIQASLEDTFSEGEEKLSLVIETAHLVSHYSPKSMIAEGFRGLRTNIQFKEAEEKIKTIAVTSASPREGKSLVSVNLAITMAQAGMRTLLVGSDMRKPIISKVFGVENTPGLTDILLGNYPWRDTVKTITDIIMGEMSFDEVMITPGMDNVYLITSGAIPPNPSVLIESKRLIEFIEEAKKEYDFMIFDSPPILSTADSAILGAKMDGVLLVYRVGSVSRGLLKRSTTQLEQVKCNVIGVVLNGIKPEISPDFQDFKYYRYYYSYGGEEKPKSIGTNIKEFIFGGKKRDSSKAEKDETGRKGSVISSSGDKQEIKKGRPWKWVLFLVALGFLSGGVLWQNGVIDPVKFFKSQPQAIEGPSKAYVKKIMKNEKGLVRSKTKPALKKKSINPGPAKSEKEPKPEISQSKNIVKDREAYKVVDRPHQKVTLYPYSLYLGSFRSSERAGKAVSMYNKKGIEPYVVKLVLKEKGEWFRIFVGHFEERDQADRFLSEHGLTEAIIKKTEYTNLINTYSSTKEMSEPISKLKNLGYFPYIIEETENKLRLLVGAYFTEARAKQLKEDLERAGISSKVIKR